MFKSQRFGMLNHHPDTGQTNYESLRTEMGHVLCMIDLVVESTEMQWQGIMRAKKGKMEKLKKWYNPTIKQGE